VLHVTFTNFDHQKQCACTYTLTLPFERVCPICSFKQPTGASFDLPTVEQMLAALPARIPAPEKKPQSKPAAKKEQAAPAQAQSAEKQPTPASNAPEKKAEAPTPVDPAALDASWSKVGLRVGKVVAVKPHPSADSLWICQVDLAESAPRQVCAGLKK
jgi:tRNA-binding EMAP/Myf-like protein